MAKFRGNDVVTVLRGLSAVSRAAANVTEAELKEAWLSPSAQSGIKNWTFNYKVEDLPKYAKEAAERSFAVARGLKELSITSAQRLVNNTGVSSQQPHQQDQFKEEDMINSLNGNGKNFTNLQENENVSIQEKASNTLENPSLTAIIERSILNPTTVNSSVEAAAVNSSNGSKIANEEMLFHTSTSTSDTSNSSNKPNGISLGSSTILKETTPESSFNEAANASPLKDSPMAPATTTRTFSFSSTDESQTVEHSGIGFSSGMVQDKSEAIKNLDQRYHPDQSVTKTQTPAIELQSSQSSVEEERNTPDSQPAQPVARKKRASKLSETSREVSVPSSRIGRLASYGSLAAGLGIGALAEITRRTLGLNEKKLTDENAPAILDASPFLTEANAERIVSTLCKVRGAALKLGQMLSIQDNSLINPQLLKIFERVRESADFMPVRQMEKVLVSQLGSDWRSNFLEFQEKPFAAASVGQVHLATLLDGREVAMKIQYPGVAQGIESDINNLVAVMNVWNILPKGLYVEEFVDVAKRELSWEVDYVREAECTRRFGALVKDKPQFKVPTVIDELCTEQIFTSEFVEGISMEQCMELDQETRNHVAENILSLCLTELFEFRFMQTDPNWANFMYNPVTRQIVLLDFGASREYSKEFVDKYIRVIEGAAEGDRQKVLEYSQALGFLAGYETKAMEEAHVEAVMILGEAFRFDKPFDFGTQDTTRRIQKLIPVMLSQRLCPPPQESYSLHRKMSGAFLLCAKLRAKINCKPFFNEITEKYHALSDS